VSKISFVHDQYELYKAKNALYGDSFVQSIKKYGQTAFATRVSDKIERLRQLLSDKDFTEELKIVNDEKVEDTARDLFNYVSMYYAFIHNMSVNKAMEYMSEKSIRMLSVLSSPYGEYRQPILSTLNPDDVKLFSKIEDILNKLMNI
jgi:hypothetical protein